MSEFGKSRHCIVTLGFFFKLALFIGLIVILGDQVSDQVTKYVQGRTTMSIHTVHESRLALPSLLLCPEPGLDVQAPYAGTFSTPPRPPYPPVGGENGTLLEYWTNATFANGRDFWISVYSGKKRKVNFTITDLFTITR